MRAPSQATATQVLRRRKGTFTLFVGAIVGPTEGLGHPQVTASGKEQLLEANGYETWSGWFIIIASV